MADKKTVKSRTKDKLVFEINKKQVPFVIGACIIVGILIFLIGMITGSTSARKGFLLSDIDAKKIKVSAPSLLEEKSGILPKESPGSSFLSENSKIKKKIVVKDKKNAKKILDKKEVTGKNASKSKTATVKPVDVKLNYYIQVGAFKNVADAKRRADQLKKKGYNVLVVKAHIPDKGVWHRVRIGPFKKLEEAKSFSIKFEKNEKISTFITKS